MRIGLRHRGILAFLWLALASGLGDWFERIPEHSTCTGDQCRIPFVLAIQGPCDPGGPCSNPSHEHHGHRHLPPPALAGSGGAKTRQESFGLVPGTPWSPASTRSRLPETLAAQGHSLLLLRHAAVRAPPANPIVFV
jgi:hypothetical protein